MSLITTNTVRQLQGKSNNVFNVFTKTLAEIEKVNQKVRFAKAKRIEKLDKVQGELNELEAIETQNQKFAQKLEDF